MKLSSMLYNIARGFGKAAVTIRDIEVTASMDPKKIGKRIYNKVVYKSANKLANKLRAK